MSNYETSTPYIASYLIIRDLGKIAFVMRSNTSWMNGFYGLPSGKVEKNESFTEAAKREAKEEVGIDVKMENLKFLHVRHRVDKEGGSEWVDVCFEAMSWEGEPYNAEPDVHSELIWLEPNRLPENVIPSVKHLLGQIEAGSQFSEYVGV